MFDFTQRFLGEEEKTCLFCKWYQDDFFTDYPDWGCHNHDSHYCGFSKRIFDTCEQWESNRGSGMS